jgi:hypothetical protein
MQLHERAADFECQDDFELGEPPTCDHTIAYRRIRNRTVRDAAGAEVRAETIYCPWRAQTIATAECAACERFAGRRPALDEKRPEAAACRVPFPEPLPLTGPTVRERHAVLSVPIGAVMRDVLCLRGDVPASEVARLVLDRGFSAVPIVDEDGRPLGVLSKTDLVRDGAPSDAAASDVMTPVVLTVPENASLGDAVELMATHAIHRVFVVADSGEITGVLTTMDVVRWLALAPGERA